MPKLIGYFVFCFLSPDASARRLRKLSSRRHVFLHYCRTWGLSSEESKSAYECKIRESDVKSHRLGGQDMGDVDLDLEPNISAHHSLKKWLGTLSHICRYLYRAILPKITLQFLLTQSYEYKRILDGIGGTSDLFRQQQQQIRLIIPSTPTTSSNGSHSLQAQANDIR